METHWNIQISIQQVDANEVRQGPIGSQTKKERVVQQVLSLAITASSEDEAYEKAYRMLNASRPVPEPHQHRASCDDASGNHLCGEK